MADCPEPRDGRRIAKNRKIFQETISSDEVENAPFSEGEGEKAEEESKEGRVITQSLIPLGTHSKDIIFA